MNPLRAARSALRPAPSLAGLLGVLLGASFCPARAAVDESKLPPASTNQVDFLRDIKPILDGHCLKCHGPEKPKSGFRLDNRAGLLKGGENGVDVKPRESAKSPLIHFVAGLEKDMEMPPKGKGEPLTAEQIGLLRAWIDQDLPWSGPETQEAQRWDITPALGWTTVRGNEQKFRELEWYREGWNGGVEDFLIQERQADGGKVTVSGHALRDDYKLTLSVERNNGRFVRAGYEQFRKYYNDTGGYWPGTAVPPLDQDLHLDLGHAWIEGGRTTPFGLQLTGGYEYFFKEGDKSVLQWMPTTTPAGAKAILPNAKHIDEHRHLLRLDAHYDWRQLLLSDALRYEFYELDTQRPFVTAGFPIVAATQRMSEGSDTRNLANAFKTELQLRDWCLVSAGYLYTHADGEEAFRQTSVDATGAPAGQFWNGRGITLEQSGHILNANLQLGLWEQMTFSSGVQTDWNRQRTFGRVHLDDTDPLNPGTIVPNTNFVNGEYDRFTAEEKFTLRNTQLPYTVLYGEARFRQERIEELQELSPLGAGFGSTGDFARDTDTFSDWRDFRAGFNVSPWSRVSLNAYGQHRHRDSDYDHNLDQRPAGNPVGIGYPAFITAREMTTDEVGTKLAVRPARWLKTTLSFKVVATDYDTVTDATPAFLGTDSTPGGRVSAGEYDAYVYSLNATLTPWRRLYLFSTFSFQDSRTVTEDHQNPSIVAYRGNVYSSLNTAQYALTELTDLQLGYDFSYADYGQDNQASGLPLGIEYHRHGLRAGVSRRFLKRFLANLEYVFSYYDEPSSGHANDFTAHGFFATLHVRWK